MSNEPSRAYITTKILQRRYCRLLKWRKPVIHNIRGPYHPDVFDGFAFDLALSIKVCKETLQDMTDVEFFERFDLRGEVSNPAHTMAERLTLAELKTVFRQEPVWFAGGFGVEGREADVKLLVYALVIGFLLETQLDDMALTVWTDPKTTMVILFELLIAFMTTVVAIAVGIGAIDLLWQKQEHLRKNRMSYKELRDETKDAEGDPYLKQERRQRGHDLARNRMMLDVPKADVVIVNPTHYAVALKWSRKRGEAPICVAKGVDTVATRIRAIAAEHGVPLHSDPPSARALYATTEIGSEIAPDHYRAVAAAIRFAERIRRKAGRRHV